MRKIVIVGSGNVAYSLSIALAGSNECSVVAIVSRNQTKGRALAAMCNTVWSSISEPIPCGDIYIITVRDSAIKEVSEAIVPQLSCDSIICHSSAVAPLIDHQRSGRFYPLQTFSEYIVADFKKITIFVESKCPKSEQILVALSGCISKSYKIINRNELEYIHLAATFANNFTNRMYHHAEQILAECGLERDILYPLIEESVSKLIRSAKSAKYLQTGAAVRGDEATINRHREMLNPHNRAIYDLITNDIKNDKL